MLLCIVMLSASATFATSDDVILTEASDEIAIDDDVLTVADESDVDSNDDILAEDSNDLVTEDTFFNYFDDSGTLLSNVTSDELIFDGDFSGIGVNYITINKPITFTGDAVFNGVTFIIDSDDVTVDGFSITQYQDMYAITIVGKSNIVLSNNIIDYTALEGFDSYGIYAFAVNGLNLINNTISFTGNTDGTVVNNAVRIEGDDENEVPSRSISFEGNDFFIDIPSVDVGYDPDTWASTVMSEGIVFYYCEDVAFVDNRLTLNYNDVTTAYGYDTIYALSVRSDAYSFGEIQSSDILIANNTIDATGNGYMYAVYVCADDFEISGNTINSASDVNYANGINIDGPSTNGDVYNNIITVDAPLATYGTYSYQYMGQIDAINYANNTITASGYLAVGMETVECDPAIVDNTIVASGNYTYGIIASIRDDGVINRNTISCLGSNVGTAGTSDSLAPKNSMGISVKGKSMIENNTIESTNIGINIVEKGDILINNNTIVVEGNNAKMDNPGVVIQDTIDYITVTNNNISTTGKYSVDVKDVDGTVNSNYLVSKKLNGDRSVYSNGSATVYNNGPAKNVIINATDIQVSYNDDAELVAVLTTEEGKGLIGANVVINLNGEDYALKTNSKGEVSLSTKGLTPKTYVATISYAGNNKYNPATTKVNVVVTKANVTLSAVYDEDAGELVATLISNVTGKGLSGANVVINLDGTDYAVKTNGKGQASISTYGIAPGNYTAAVTYNGNSKYNPSSINVDISITKSDTYFTADDVSVAYNDATGELVATLFDVVDDQGIAGAEVVISINDNNYTLVTDDNGQVSVSTVGLTPNTYKAVISYAGDESFRESETEVNVVVTKASADIIAPDVSVAYNDKTGELVATVISSITGKGLIGANVVINLNGVDYALKTNSKGEVNISTVGLTPKTYVATITYNGNNKYEAISTTANVVVSKADVTLSAVYDEDANELVATLISDITGKGLSGANIVINLDGASHTLKTNGKGQVRLPTDELAPGDYTAIISYNGNNKYNSGSTSIDFTIE